MLALLKTLGVVADGALAAADFTSMFGYNDSFVVSSMVGYPCKVRNTPASV